MKIAIIGGSIAGCALAALLKDTFEITVFEKAKNLQSRGAGIAISHELLQALITKGLVNENIPTYSIDKRSFHCQSPSQPKYGKFLWQQDIAMTTLHWNTLFTNLRSHVPNEIYRSGCKVREVKLSESSQEIILESGEREEFDFVVFADGYQSMGREVLSEGSNLSYGGYVAWRGLLDFELVKDKMPFIKSIPYYCFDNGHFLAYIVHHEDKKQLNWVFYEKISLETLHQLGSTLQSDFSSKAKEHLYEFTNKLPTAIAQIVMDTKSPFMQQIFNTSVVKIASKQAIIHGDAGLVLPPHVGNGASLAIQDALHLADMLNSFNDFYQAIVQWEKDTLPNRLSIYELAKRMGNALVLNPVLWQGMDAVKMIEWWEQILLGEKWYTTKNLPLTAEVLN